MPEHHGPHHWRALASKARLLSDQMHDPESKWAMARIAESYEILAQRAEARLAQTEKPKP